MIYEDKEAQDDVNTITLLRILDVLYAIHLKLDEPAAKRLVDKHDSGGLIGPMAQTPDPDQIL